MLARTLAEPVGGWERKENGNPGEGDVHLVGLQMPKAAYTRLTLALTLPSPTYNSTHSLTHFFRPHYKVIIIGRVGQRAISTKDSVKGRN